MTDARAVFETSVNRLAGKPETLPKSKPLYIFFHKYESDYGELSQIARLEQRMADLFPEDPKLQRFASRYSMEGFDPTIVRPVISPKSQMRPKPLGGAGQAQGGGAVMQSIEQHQPYSARETEYRGVSPRPQYREASARPTYAQHQQREQSPRPTYGHLQQQTNSPKRSHAQYGSGQVDEFGRDIPYGRAVENDRDYDHNEGSRPRKLARGESPLKGAAGRRLDQQKRALGGQIGRTEVYRGEERKEVVIPRDITFLLSIIPKAETYTNVAPLNAEKLVGFLQRVRVPSFVEWKRERDLTLQGGMGRY